MGREPRSITERSSLTRISVTGAGNHYIVRNGGEGPVRVWVRHDGLNGLSCECGRAHCTHIASLQMCGFLEPSQGDLKAA